MSHLPQHLTLPVVVIPHVRSIFAATTARKLSTQYSGSFMGPASWLSMIGVPASLTRGPASVQFSDTFFTIASTFTKYAGRLIETLVLFTHTIFHKSPVSLLRIQRFLPSQVVQTSVEPVPLKTTVCGVSSLLAS